MLFKIEKIPVNMSYGPIIDLFFVQRNFKIVSSPLHMKCVHILCCFLIRF